MTTKPRQLPVEERIKLVEDLWDSIAADQQALQLTYEDQLTALGHGFLDEVHATLRLIAQTPALYPVVH